MEPREAIWRMGSTKSCCSSPAAAPRRTPWSSPGKRRRAATTTTAAISARRTARGSPLPDEATDRGGDAAALMGCEREERDYQSARESSIARERAYSFLDERTDLSRRADARRPPGRAFRPARASRCGTGGATPARRRDDRGHRGRRLLGEPPARGGLRARDLARVPAPGAGGQPAPP